MTRGASVISVLQIEADLSELPTAMVNNIQREARQHLEAIHKGLPAFLTNTVRVSETTWKAVSRLTLDVTDGQTPPATLATAIPPLARTLLDSIMAIVFVFGDATDRLNWYYRAGWTEACKIQGQLDARFGALPEWDGFLSDHRGWVASHETDFGITPAEQATPTLATAAWKGLNAHGYWPNPGKMIGIERKRAASGRGDAARADYLAFLNDWFYARLSGDSHLSYMGLARRGGILHEQHAGANREGYRSQVVLGALVLHVALLSEIVVSASLTTLHAKARRIWALLRPHQEAEDLWTQRYDALLVVPDTEE